MATVKKTLSLEADAWAFATRAAEKAGMSTSAWLSRAARQHAIQEGYQGGPAVAEAESSAIADEDELAAAEAEGWRAAG